jgi:hypothetical protein
MKYFLLEMCHIIKQKLVKESTFVISERDSFEGMLFDKSSFKIHY